MAKKRPTRAQRALLHEMAKNERVIFLQKHPRQWGGIRYAINSFPMRTLHGTTVAQLAQNGYLQLDRRGYYVLTAKGQLQASVDEQRSES